MNRDRDSEDARPSTGGGDAAHRSAEEAAREGGSGAGGLVEGEGSYTAARRHRDSAEQFVQSGQVEPAAREAAPESAQEEDELRSAEEAGRSHAKR